MDVRRYAAFWALVWVSARNPKRRFDCVRRLPDSPVPGLDPRDDQQGSQHPEPSRAEAKEGNRELNFPRLDFESGRAITDDSGLVFKPRDVGLGSHCTRLSANRRIRLSGLRDHHPAPSVFHVAVRVAFFQLGRTLGVANELHAVESHEEAIVAAEVGKSLGLRVVDS